MNMKTDLLGRSGTLKTGEEAIIVGVVGYEGGISFLVEITDDGHRGEIRSISYSEITLDEVLDAFDDGMDDDDYDDDISDWA